MRSLNLGALTLSLGLAGGCEILVDANGKGVGDSVVDATSPITDPCVDSACKTGTHCELVQAQCVTAPCNPVPECVPNAKATDAAVLTPGSGEACGKSTCESGLVCCNESCGICTKPDGVCIQLACEESPAPASCAVTLCQTGTSCMDTPQGAVCVPSTEDPCNLLGCPPNRVCEVVEGAATCVLIEAPASTCAATLCPTGTYCDDISGQAECLPLPSCDQTSCGAGTHCELIQVQCVRAPCPPQPSCVTDADPCAALDCANCKVVGWKAQCGVVDCPDPCTTAKCKNGTHCEAVEVTCFAAPCCPVANCVSNGGGSGDKCGASTCSSGSFCCNASCGICAPSGSVCTQQVCSSALEASGARPGQARALRVSQACARNHAFRQAACPRPFAPRTR